MEIDIRAVTLMWKRFFRITMFSVALFVSAPMLILLYGNILSKFQFIFLVSIIIAAGLAGVVSFLQFLRYERTVKLLLKEVYHTEFKAVLLDEQVQRKIYSFKSFVIFIIFVSILVKLLTTFIFSPFHRILISGIYFITIIIGFSLLMEKRLSGIERYIQSK